MDGDSELNNTSFAGENQSYGEEESNDENSNNGEEAEEDALDVSGGNQNDSYLSDNYLTEQQQQRYTHL